MKLTILGQVASKKNSKSIVYNRRTGRPMVISSKTHNSWHDDAAKQLMGFRKVTEYPARMTLDIYVGDKRKRDIDNMVASIMDLLQDMDIIESDAWQYIQELTARVSGVDKEKPRVIIEIEPLVN